MDTGVDDLVLQAGVGDWVMHVITFPWKIVFAFCPPLEYADGWLTFFISLSMIGRRCSTDSRILRCAVQVV